MFKGLSNVVIHHHESILSNRYVKKEQANHHRAVNEHTVLLTVINRIPMSSKAKLAQKAKAFADAKTIEDTGIATLNTASKKCVTLLMAHGFTAPQIATMPDLDGIARVIFDRKVSYELSLILGKMECKNNKPEPRRRSRGTAVTHTREDCRSFC